MGHISILVMFPLTGGGSGSGPDPYVLSAGLILKHPSGNIPRSRCSSFVPTGPFLSHPLFNPFLSVPSPVFLPLSSCHLSVAAVRPSSPFVRRPIRPSPSLPLASGLWPQFDHRPCLLHKVVFAATFNFFLRSEQKKFNSKHFYGEGGRFMS